MAALETVSLVLGVLAVVASVAHSAAAPEDFKTKPVQIMTDWQWETAMVLSLSRMDLNLSSKMYTVVPLTRPAGLNETDKTRNAIWIKGKMVAADATNFDSIAGDGTVAYLSCDQNFSDSSSYVDSSYMLNAIVKNLPRAIVLYSLELNSCSLSGPSNGLATIYAMTDATEARDVLNVTSYSKGVVLANIAGGNITDAADSPSSATQATSGPAVAMSILYSITALVILLFLAIITTGAIRAHRHPERYGPRDASSGRPRQSRAKGLARAVLETIPIVKFGDAEPAKKGDADRESELSPAPPSRGAHPQAAQPSPDPAGPQARPSTSRGTPAEQETDSGAGASGSADAATGDDGLGCSICTDEFTVGEDVRLLPCNHKFHPQCVDPWLVNVSGTCPLCRLDLRPQSPAACENQGGPDGSPVATVANPDDPDGSPAAAVGSAATLAPPLEADEDEAPVAVRRSRASRFFDLNGLWHAPLEERVEAIRRYLAEQRDHGDAGRSADIDGGEAEERSRRARLTVRLKERFRIRTRAQSPGDLERAGGASSSRP